jgi:hypothetical protein
MGCWKNEVLLDVLRYNTIQFKEERIQLRNGIYWHGEPPQPPKRKVCSSRPDCSCGFCVESRAAMREGRTARDLLRQAAAQYIRSFTR